MKWVNAYQAQRPQNRLTVHAPQLCIVTGVLADI